MGVSVLQCKWCRKYYADFFKNPRQMRFLVRLHKENHSGRQAKTGRSDTT